MSSRHFPTTNRCQIPAFLHHLAILLTCGDEDDTENKKVVAFTGSLTAEGLNILVAIQNPSKCGDHAKRID